MPANRKKMIVYKTSDGEFRVQPPVVDLDFLDPNGAEVFVLRNHTDEDLVVYIGPNAFGASAVAEPLLQKGKLTKTATSQGILGTVNSYTLQIFGTVSGKKAKGNSDPVIIIEN
jgi:hypothetical protein